MLAALFGSKSIETILLFLLVNEKCYPTQLHRMFDAPLTPLQKGCEKLEKAGVIKSVMLGKTRLYQLNPAYPLITELEMLLKKAYSSLSPQEKKKYYYVSHGEIKKQSPTKILTEVWERLKSVSEVTFVAKSHSKNGLGWKGRGSGSVIASYDNDATIVFHEEGVRTIEEEQEFHFTNTLRWQLHRLDGVIGLEHLRFGMNHPVFMFHLAPSGKNCLESLHSHLCKEDTYFGALYLEAHALRFSWRIIGPKKNEELECIYN